MTSNDFSNHSLALCSLVATVLLVSACDREVVEQRRVADAETDIQNNVDTTVEPAQGPQFPAPDDENARKSPAIVTDDTPDRLQPVNERLFATAVVEPVGDSGVSGELQIREENEMLSIKGKLSGLEPGMHGLHIHTNGDCSGNGASSAGAHFAPQDDPHGSPDNRPALHHAGDLGNISANADGEAEIMKTDGELTLHAGENSIMHRAIIIHADADDLHSQPSGNSGNRIGCGIVTPNVDAVF